MAFDGFVHFPEPGLDKVSVRNARAAADHSCVRMGNDWLFASLQRTAGTRTIASYTNCGKCQSQSCVVGGGFRAPCVSPPDVVTRIDTTSRIH